MADISKLAVLLTLNPGQFNSGCKTAGVEVESFGAKVDGVAGTIGGLGLKLAALGATLLGGIGLGSGIKLAADFETAEVAMTTMLRSSTAAKTVLADLSAFAASTPFEFPELLQASTKLIGFGIAGKDVLGVLKLIGDVAAGVAVPIGELADTFGRNLASGRLYTKDINEFQGRGIPIVQALQKELGKTRAEVLGLVEAGQIGSASLIAAFQSMAGAGGQFEGLMAKTSLTVNGLFSTLKDNVGISLRKMGETLIKELDVKDGMVRLIAWTEAFGKSAISAFAGAATWVNQHSLALTTLGKVLGFVAAGVVAYKTALFALTVAQRAWAAGQAIVLGLQGPKGWAVLAGAAIAAGVAYGVVSSSFKNISEEAARASAETEKVAAAQVKAADAGGLLDTQAGLARQKNELLTAGIGALTTKLREQVDGFGLSGTSLDIWRLKQQGATDQMTANVEALNVQLMALEENKKAMEEMGKAAERIAEDVKTPWEKLYDTLAEINNLQKAGLLTAEQVSRASKKARDAADKKDKVKEPAAPEFGRVALEAIEKRFTAGFTAANTPAEEAARKLAERTAKAAEKTAKNTDTLAAKATTAAAGTDI
jgi:tape measure domain-containing protein